MRWSELTKNLETIASGGAADPDVVDVTYDSRTAGPGSVFIAVPGFKAHGDAFIRSAVDRGAVAVVSENARPDATVPWLQVHNSRAAAGRIALALWGANLPQVLLAGITGTNGKTTTAMLYHSLFERRFGTRRAWFFGTVAYRVDGTRLDAPRTTPEAADLLRYFGRAAQAPAAVAMEVSSHALALDRVAGLTFDLGVWTNLTQDHLDFHKTMEAYYEAKKRLFTTQLKPAGCAVINTDDPWGRRLHAEIAATVRCLTYGEDPRADVRIDSWRCDWNGSELCLVYKKEPAYFTSRLTGAFNRYNITAMAAGAFATGGTAADIQAALNGLGVVPGRIERVPLAANFAVVVDYAHTPDALEKILATSRDLTRGRLICVFGCGGDRDRTKRPLMAQAVARLSDEAVITSDNPRGEDPLAIIDEILRGMPLDFPHLVIADRAAAIRAALEHAAAGDCVVIAGKGHENYQEITGVRHHFDDRETAMAAYGALVSEASHV